MLMQGYTTDQTHPNVVGATAAGQQKIAPALLSMLPAATVLT